MIVRTERTITYYIDEEIPDGTFDTDEWGKRLHNHPDRDGVVEELSRAGTVMSRGPVNRVFEPSELVYVRSIQTPSKSAKWHRQAPSSAQPLATAGALLTDCKLVIRADWHQQSGEPPKEDRHCSNCFPNYEQRNSA